MGRGHTSLPLSLPSSPRRSEKNRERRGKVGGFNTLQNAAFTHGHRFFRRGGKFFFSCVHGSKKAIEEVMFLAAVAWVKGEEGKFYT